MSLIADALKAAQEERAPRGAGRASSPRRAVAAAALRGPAPVRARGGRRSGPPLPPGLRVALGAFGAAVVAAGTLVAVAPGGSATLEREMGLPDAVETVAAGFALPAPVPAAAGPLDGRAARVDEVTGPPALEFPEESAESPGPEVDDAPRPEPVEDAAGSSPTPPPAPADATPSAPSAAAGRFELTVRNGGPSRSRAFADAVAAQRRGDFGAAAALYEQVVAADPAHAEAYNNLGATHQARGDLEAARDAYRRALAAQPRYAAAWSNLGVVLGSLGDDAEAQTALAEAIRLEPGNAGAKVNLALLYQRQGLVADARRILVEVVAAAPRLAEGQYALGRVLEQEGDTPGAVRHYQLFLEAAQGRFPQLEPAVRQRVDQLGGLP